MANNRVWGHISWRYHGIGPMEKHISYYIQINDENVVETDPKLIRVIIILILDKNYCQQ